jgi:hypothetical protein
MNRTFTSDDVQASNDMLDHESSRNDVTTGERTKQSRETTVGYRPSDKVK